MFYITLIQERAPSPGRQAQVESTLHERLLDVPLSAWEFCTLHVFGYVDNLSINTAFYQPHRPVTLEDENQPTTLNIHGTETFYEILDVGCLDSKFQS